MIIILFLNVDVLTFITFTEWQGTFLLNSFIVYEMCSSVLGALDPLVVLGYTLHSPCGCWPELL